MHLLNIGRGTPGRRRSIALFLLLDCALAMGLACAMPAIYVEGVAMGSAASRINEIVSAPLAVRFVMCLSVLLAVPPCGAGSSTRRPGAALPDDGDSR